MYSLRASRLDSPGLFVANLANLCSSATYDSCVLSEKVEKALAAYEYTNPFALSSSNRRTAATTKHGS